MVDEVFLLPLRFAQHPLVRGYLLPCITQTTLLAVNIGHRLVLAGYQQS